MKKFSGKHLKTGQESNKQYREQFSVEMNAYFSHV